MGDVTDTMSSHSGRPPDVASLPGSEAGKLLAQIPTTASIVTCSSGGCGDSSIPILFSFLFIINNYKYIIIILIIILFIYYCYCYYPFLFSVCFSFVFYLFFSCSSPIAIPLFIFNRSSPLQYGEQPWPVRGTELSLKNSLANGDAPLKKYAKARGLCQ